MVRNKEAFSVNVLLLSLMCYSGTELSMIRNIYYLSKFCILSGLSLPSALISEAYHWVNTQKGEHTQCSMSH